MRLSDRLVRVVRFQSAAIGVQIEKDNIGHWTKGMSHCRLGDENLILHGLNSPQ